MVEKIAKTHLIGLERLQSDSERVFQNVKFIYKIYYVCILSTNINQYLVFWLLQWTCWVYDLGAQVRKM
jgi:hypothetical protein